MAAAARIGAELERRRPTAADRRCRGTGRASPGPVEDRVEERAEPADLVRGPGEGAVEQVEDAADDDEQSGQRPRPAARPRSRRRPEIPKPMTVSALGVRPSRPKARAIGNARPRTRARSAGVIDRAASRGRPVAGWVSWLRRLGGRGCRPGARRTRRTPRAAGGRRLAADPAACSRGRRPGAGRRATTRAAATAGPGRRAPRRSPRPAARLRTIRRRLTSARALWTSAARAAPRAGGRRWRSCCGRGRARGSG